MFLKRNRPVQIVLVSRLPVARRGGRGGIFLEGAPSRIFHLARDSVRGRLHLREMRQLRAEAVYLVPQPRCIEGGAEKISRGRIEHQTLQSKRFLTVQNNGCAVNVRDLYRP